VACGRPAHLGAWVDTNHLARFTNRPRQLNGEVSWPASNIDDRLSGPWREGFQRGEAALDHIRPTVGVLEQAGGFCIELQHDHRSGGAASLRRSLGNAVWEATRTQHNRSGLRDENDLVDGEKKKAAQAAFEGRGCFKSPGRKQVDLR
jgi:hypothetical protein